MKTIKISALLVLVMNCFIFTACDTETVDPVDNGFQAENTQNARVTVYRNSYQLNYDEPTWFKFVTGCNDEQLRLVGGTLRVQSTVVVKGTHITLQNQGNASGLRVLDEATGTVYVGSFTYKHNEKYSYAVYFPYTYKETRSIVLTAPGRGNNLHVKVDIIYKVDADGVTTVDVEDYRVDCSR